MEGLARKLGGVLLLALGAGCAQVAAPPASTAAPEATRTGECGGMVFEQFGRRVSSDGRRVTLQRAPFTILFPGERPPMPWLHAASGHTVLAGLEPKDHPRLWLVDGLGIARTGANDLQLARGAEIANDPATHARMAGAAYAAAVRDQEARHPGVRHLAALPFNRVQAQDRATGEPVMLVMEIDGTPVMRTTHAELDIVKLVPRQTYPVGPRGTSSLRLATWSRCHAAFR